MTVAQLIERLQRCDAEAMVVFADGTGREPQVVDVEQGHLRVPVIHIGRVVGHDVRSVVRPW